MTLANRALDVMGAGFLERYLKCRALPTTHTEQWIRTPSGARLYAHVHRPVADGTYPGVVIVPGAGSPGTAYDHGGDVTADDVAAMGFVVIHYDPSGRGRSDGEEDHWGPVHQQELVTVLQACASLPDVAPESMGVLSFSIGISIAAGALARHETPFVKYLFDWEGPSNRFNITRNDTHPPLKAFPTSDVAFWKPREAATHIGSVSCGYFRFQAQRDHMQGGYKGHATELLNLATEGEAKWTRLNDHPKNTRFEEAHAAEYNWVPPWRNHKGQILKYLLELRIPLAPACCPAFPFEP